MGRKSTTEEKKIPRIVIHAYDRESLWMDLSRFPKTGWVHLSFSKGKIYVDGKEEK